MGLESSLENDNRSAAAAVFDSLAAQYDSIWSSGLIGSLQREQVWWEIQQVFRAGEQVLEIGCGTGVDAVHLAKAGIRVIATDVSVQMLTIARERIEREGLKDKVSLEHQAIEELKDFRGSDVFDGAFSNFGAFNCIQDLRESARALARLVRPGGKLVICYMNRFCLWEIIWYLFHVRPGKALRRLTAGAKGLKASLYSEAQMRVFYPKAQEFISNFRGGFRLASSSGIGVFVPPSFMEKWACKRPGCLGVLAWLDRNVRRWPVLRVIGDHRLLIFTRIDPCKDEMSSG